MCVCVCVCVYIMEQGYVGQDMHWTLFYYPGPDDMPPTDVSGLGGEKQEFGAVDWSTWSLCSCFAVGFGVWFGVWFGLWFGLCFALAYAFFFS